MHQYILALLAALALYFLLQASESFAEGFNNKKRVYMSAVFKTTHDLTKEKDTVIFRGDDSRENYEDSGGPKVSKKNGLTLLTSKIKPLDQNGNSCTGHAVAQALRYALSRYMKGTEAHPIKPHPYFLYYTARCQGQAIGLKDALDVGNGVMVGNCMPMDDGIYAISALTQLTTRGFISRDDWNADDVYDVPGPSVVEKAAKNRDMFLRPSWWEVVLVKDIPRALKRGHAVVITVTWNPKFESLAKAGPLLKVGKNSPVLKPGGDEDPDTDFGHTLLVIGYDEKKERFLVLNSFGDEWGLEGTAWMPADYLREQSWTKAKYLDKKKVKTSPCGYILRLGMF